MAFFITIILGAEKIKWFKNLPASEHIVFVWSQEKGANKNNNKNRESARNEEHQQIFLEKWLDF